MQMNKKKTSLKRQLPVPENLNDTISSMPPLDEFSQHSVLESTVSELPRPPTDGDEFDDSLEELFVQSPVRSPARSSKKRRL